MVRSPPYGTPPDDDYVGILFGFQSNRYLKFASCLVLHSDLSST